MYKLYPLSIYFIDTTVNTTVPSFEANASIYANTEVTTDLYENPGAAKATPPPYDPMIPEIRPILLEAFGQYVAENHYNLNTGFREHYKVYTHLTHMYSHVHIHVLVVVTGGLLCV